MIYEFQSEDGRIIEEEGDPRHPPPIDSCIERGGVVYKRVASTPHLAVSSINNAMPSLPLWHPDAKRYDGRGAPVMRSNDEALEFAKRANHRAGFEKYQWKDKA